MTFLGDLFQEPTFSWADGVCEQTGVRPKGNRDWGELAGGEPKALQEEEDQEVGQHTIDWEDVFPHTDMACDVPLRFPGWRLEAPLAPAGRGLK